jgi:hypothetical protein
VSEYETKLAESNLTLQDAKANGLKHLDADATAALSDNYRQAESLFLPYHDSDGKQLEFHRVRYLDFNPMGAKYAMPKGQPPHVYLPPTLSWKTLRKKGPLTITEGELKSLCAAKHGINCIGLGGVWSFRSKALGITFLPELEAIDWQDRDVELCFDSDIAVKSAVRGALVSLSRELSRRGAKCSMVNLPHGGDNKTGLDDFLVAHGIEEYNKLERLPVHEDEAERIEMFSNWYYVLNDDHVVDYTHGKPIVYRGRTHFVNAVSNQRVTGADDKPIAASTAWYNDPNRQTMSYRVFDPTTTERVVHQDGKPCINMHLGLAAEPRRGSVAPMLKVVDAVVGKRPDLRKWLLQWFAYPLQNPGAKLHSCVYVYSPMQGVGKSAIGEVMLDIYGRHRSGVMIAEDEFFGNWNAWQEASLFALCDELSFDGQKKSRSQFKRAITAESLQLSAKYRGSQTFMNYCNFYFTGQSAGGLPLESHSSNRRACIIEVAEALGEEWFTTTFDTWRHAGGASAWLYYLLHTVDCTGFSPRGDAFATEEVGLAIDSSISAVDSWVREETLEGGALAKHKVWKYSQIVALNELHAEESGARPATRASLTRALGQEGWVHYGRVKMGDKKEVMWLDMSLAKLKGKKPAEIAKRWHATRGVGSADST